MERTPAGRPFQFRRFSDTGLRHHKSLGVSVFLILAFFAFYDSVSSIVFYKYGANIRAEKGWMQVLIG